MAQLLQGKVALITGGTTGIGRAIGLEYLRQGAFVAINHLDDSTSHSQFRSLQQEARETQPQAQAEALLSVPGDISKHETATDLMQKTVAKFGRLDILVSNAGVCKFEDFLAVTPELLDKSISTNLSGAFYAVQAAARQMVSQHDAAVERGETPTGGSIIGISSISALVGGAQQTHYTPTKAGILSLMQSCACALGKYGIRCNALLPGTIRTQMNEEDLKDEEKARYMRQRTPLGRIGQTGDLAGPAVFLASEMSKFVTGSQMLVDGG